MKGGMAMFPPECGAGSLLKQRSYCTAQFYLDLGMSTGKGKAGPAPNHAVLLAF
jgi:hypothetical protein